MAITKRTEQDKIEVVGTFKFIQVRTATVIEEDGVELSRSFARHVVAPNISADDLADQSADVQGMHTLFHTDAVKTAYQAHLDSLVTEEDDE